MCDAYVGRSIHCKPNTRAGILNPDRLLQSQDKDVLISRVLSTTAAVLFLSHLHCHKSTLPSVQSGQGVGGSNSWSFIQPHSQEGGFIWQRAPGGGGAVHKALVNTHH